jgi:phage terminase small subunit
MPILSNRRHEQFATLIAGGMTPTKAYSAAGFTGRGSAQSASRLAKSSPVAARIAELSHDLSCMARQRAVVDREYVLRRLRENVERAMQVKPVLDSKGKPVGTYRYDGSVANRALELIGKELEMFRDGHDHTFKWDGDPKKLTKEQLETLTKALEEQVFGDDVAAATAAREAAIRNMRVQ